MKRLFTFITLLFLSFYTGNAQENLKKHTVSSGETLLSISKKYNITPFDLQKANPNAVDGIKIDDILVIPESTNRTSANKSESDINTSAASSSISHTVKKDESKFSISKRYGLTVSELEIQNPQIISGLNLGQVLEIFPSPAFVRNDTTQTSSKTLNKKGKTHQVSSGETLFGIASANGLTIEQLEQANSKTISGSLKIGQILWIQGSDDELDSNGDYHVKYGDTKFSLARRFDTSVREMERKNPHITNMLIVGQIINMTSGGKDPNATPSAKTETKPATKILPTEKVKEAEKVLVMEKVPSEAPAEIIKKPTENIVNNEKLPTEVVQKAKEPTVSVKAPSVELTPEEKPNELVATNTPSEETIEVSNATSNTVSNTSDVLTLPKITSGFADLRTSAHISPSKKLLFFLPFSEANYQNYAINDANFKNVSDDFKRNHLEFYKGATIAIDSIRKMNLPLDVNVVEAQSVNQTSKTKSLIKDHNIKDYDAIILPFYKTLEEDIAAFTADGNTPVITATTIDNKNNINNLYSALPSENQQRLKVLNYIIAKGGHIIVMNDLNRVESKAFISEQAPKADFISIKKNGSFSDAELKSKLKKGQLNYVIIDSERNSTFLNTTTALLSELSNFQIQLAVLEASLIPDNSNVSQKRYQILKMIFPSLIPAKSTESSKQFLSTYQKKHKLLPSANIMLGFDITFDSLLRLMQQQSFENSAQNDITEYTQLKFNYEKNTLGGYSNEGIYILQYDSDAQIREAN